MEFSRQEYWNGLPFPSPGDLPDPGIKPQSPASQADALPSEPPGKGEYCYKQQMGMKGVWAVFLFFSFVNVISSITLPQYNLFWNNKLPEISWCHREKKRDIKDQFNVSFWFLLFLCSVLGLELQFHHICGLFPNCSYLWGRIDWEAYSYGCDSALEIIFPQWVISCFAKVEIVCTIERHILYPKCVHKY